MESNLPSKIPFTSGDDSFDRCYHTDQSSEQTTREEPRPKVKATMERYKRIEKTDNQIGLGAYGVVYKCLDLETNKMVALKRIRLEVEDEGIPTTALREITLLRLLEHPNIVKLENVVMDPGRLALVFELVDMDLKKFMDDHPGPLPLDLLRSYTAQLLEGLAYCHSMGVMHRDLKPHNILVDKIGNLKIADFGLARAFTPARRELTVEVITRWYRPPEILLGEDKYSCSVDVWSAGCIIAELSTKKALFPGDSEIDQLHRIFRLLGTPTRESWPAVTELPFWRPSFPRWSFTGFVARLPTLSSTDNTHSGVSLLEKMLQLDPAKRITAIEAVHHPFVKDFLAFPASPRSPRHNAYGGFFAEGSSSGSIFATPSEPAFRGLYSTRSAAPIQTGAVVLGQQTGGGHENNNRNGPRDAAQITAAATADGLVIAVSHNNICSSSIALPFKTPEDTAQNPTMLADQIHAVTATTHYHHFHHNPQRITGKMETSESVAVGHIDRDSTGYSNTDLSHTGDFETTTTDSKSDSEANTTAQSDAVSSSCSSVASVSAISMASTLSDSDAARPRIPAAGTDGEEEEEDISDAVYPGEEDVSRAVSNLYDDNSVGTLTDPSSSSATEPQPSGNGMDKSRSVDLTHGTGRQNRGRKPSLFEAQLKQSFYQDQTRSSRSSSTRKRAAASYNQDHTTVSTATDEQCSYDTHGAGASKRTRKLSSSLSLTAEGIPEKAVEPLVSLSSNGSAVVSTANSTTATAANEIRLKNDNSCRSSGNGTACGARRSSKRVRESPAFSSSASSSN